jgi:hypothetical protein
MSGDHVEVRDSGDYHTREQRLDFLAHGNVDLSCWELSFY